MMRISSITMVLIFWLTEFAVCQSNGPVDKVNLKNGETLAVKVTDVYPGEVFYVTQDQPGSKKSLAKSLIKSITYSNGSSDSFNGSSGSFHMTSGNANSAIDTYEGRTEVLSSAESYSFEEVFDKNTNLVYYGLDFTRASFVGERHEVEHKRFKGNLLLSINDQIISEERKFNFSRPFKKKSFEKDVAMVVANNSSVRISTSSKCEGRQLSREEVQMHINAYNPKAQQGIGLLILVDCLNYESQKASFEFVLFDIKSKSVLHTSSLSGSPGGIGWKGYWMNSLYDALGKYKPLAK